MKDYDDIRILAGAGSAELRLEAKRRGVLDGSELVLEKGDLVRLLEESQAAALAKVPTKQLKAVPTPAPGNVDATSVLQNYPVFGPVRDMCVSLSR